MKHRLVGLTILLCSVAAPAPVRAEGVGVVAFEAVPAGQPAPDFALLLAERLAVRGVGHVAGPGEIGAPPDFEPTPSEAQG